MAISGSNLVSPMGEIDPSLFPDDDENQLLERLDSYLTEAEGKSAGVSDNGKKAWAYYRAFRAVFIRLSSTPGASLDDQGNIKYSDAQIANFNAVASEYLTAWNEIISGTDSSSKNLPPTTSVTNKVVY